MKEPFPLDWNRAIYVQSKIDDNLTKSLAPSILKMRQESRAPITVGVDSLGGKITSLETLLGLLRGDRIQSNNSQYFCVALDSAVSAAALLLSRADYAVAYPHSKILFHDIRFSELTDVTPDRALQSAKDLQRENDRMALLLASVVAKRLIWNYIVQRGTFEKSRKEYSGFVVNIEPALNEICPQSPDHHVDVLGFALSLYHACGSHDTAAIILRTIERLAEWVFIEKIEKTIVNHEEEDNGQPKLMDGINAIYRQVSASRRAETKTPEAQNQSELMLGLRLQDDLRLFLEIILRRASRDPDWSISNGGFDAIQRDFDLVKGLRSTHQINSIIQLMLKYDMAFFGRDISAELEKAQTKEERRSLLNPYFPQARLFWYFAVLLCRNLFDGENLISANDAQLLGLIDEVCGGGPVESLRDWRLKQPDLAEPGNEIAL